MARHVAPLVALAVMGCGSESELVRGSFDYECVADEDSACWGTLSPTGVPDRIAVGGLFAIDYKPFEGAPNHAVVPVSNDRASSNSSGTMQLVEEGVQALLAQNLTTKATSDYLVVNGVRPADLFVSDEQDPSADPLPSIELEVMMPTTFFVRPAGPDGATLPGALTFTWTTEDPMVATVEVAMGTTAEATITAQGAGTTNLTIAAGVVDVTFAVHAVGGMMP